MSAEFFLDTNVFVYSFDPDAPEKQARARDLIAAALEGGNGAISMQVVQEFLSVATRKFASPLNASQAGLYLKEVLMPLCAVYPSEDLSLRSLRILEDTGYGLHDSLIVAAALEAGAKRLLTEDLQHGKQIEGLRIENPFLA